MLRHTPLVYNQSRFMQQGNLPKNLPQTHLVKGELVYYGILSKRFVTLKFVTITTSLVGMLFVPGVLTNPDLANLSLAVKGIMGVMLSSFLFLTPCLVHIFSKRYVNWIYYNKDSEQFTVTVYDFFARPVDLTFTPAEVEYHHGMMSVIKIQGRELFVDPNGFFDSAVYQKMMRYDTEEWFIPDEEENTEEKEKQSSKETEEKKPTK